MSMDQKLRASGTGNHNQMVYWVLVIVAIGVLVWVWGGHRKDARVVQKVKPSTVQKTPIPGVVAPVRIVKTPSAVAPPPIVPSNAPAEIVVAPPMPLRPVPTVKPVSRTEPSIVETPVLPTPRSANKILDSQVALVRLGISPGSIDGLMGSQTRAAVRAFQMKAGIICSGTLDTNTLLRLATGISTYTNYTVTEGDLARLLPLANTWLGKSQQERLDYETLLECIGEKFFAHPSLLKQLNPGVDWASVTPGTSLVVPNAEYPPPPAKAALLKIFLEERCLEAFDSENTLLAHFPCSIAQRVEKRPLGEELHVAVLAPNPNYTFDPAVFPESAEAQEIGRKLILNPGPNNPVGTVWIGLDKPGYGIHGTPHPEAVGRTESHGCFRLANWNAEYLLRLVSLGTPVQVEP